MRVEVLVAGPDGKLPKGQKLAMMGNMLHSAAMGASRGQAETVVPFTYQGVTAVLVKGDPADPNRIGNLVFHGGEQLNLGEGDELVLQQCQVDALSLGGLVGLSGRSGVTLVGSPQPVFELFRIKAA